MIRLLKSLVLRHLRVTVMLALVITMATSAVSFAFIPSVSLAQEEPEAVNDAGEANTEDGSGNPDGNSGTNDGNGQDESGSNDSTGDGSGSAEGDQGSATDDEPTGDAAVAEDLANDSGNEDGPGGDQQPTGDAKVGEEVAEDQAEDDSGSSDNSGGFLDGIAVDMIKSIFNWIGDGIEKEAEARAADLASQLTQGRYMIEPPNNGLTTLYDNTADWAKFAAIPLLLLLGLSMCLNGANYDTSHAVQTGMPRIITMIAGMAFMPEIITVIADMTQSVSNAVIDVDAMQAGFESLGKGELAIKISPAATVIVWIIKGLLSLLLLFAIAMQNLIFGVLFMVGPLAIIFYAIPRFSDIAAAWFRGILACFAISILWSLEFGFGYRLVADPTLLYESTGWRLLPLLLSIGILWLAWKTPWWVYQWAFYSYSAGGGGGGTRGAMTAVNLFRLFRSGSK